MTAKELETKFFQSDYQPEAWMSSHGWAMWFKGLRSMAKFVTESDPPNEDDGLLELKETAPEKTSPARTLSLGRTFAGTCAITIRPVTGPDGQPAGCFQVSLPEILESDA
jgi:hypothetical protein